MSQDRTKKFHHDRKVTQEYFHWKTLVVCSHRRRKMKTDSQQTGVE